MIMDDDDDDNDDAYSSVSASPGQVNQASALPLCFWPRMRNPRRGIFSMGSFQPSRENQVYLDW